MKLLFLLAFILSGSALGQAPPGASVAADDAAVERVRLLLQRPDRLAWDLKLDPGRKPVELVRQLGVRSGMTVLDLAAHVGYTTEILSAAVGPDGQVISHNEAEFSRWLSGDAGIAYRERYMNGRLPNVREYITLIDHMPFSDKLDLVYWGNNLHDYYNKHGPDKVIFILQNVMMTLKPGGILGVVDHVGTNLEKNKRLHRVDPTVVAGLIEDAGFEVLRVSDLYRNPDDDYDRKSSDRRVRGMTDRIFLVARKPPSGVMKSSPD